MNAVYMIGTITMIGFDRLCARREPIGAPIGLSGLVSDVSGRYVHEIVHGHAHVQTDQVNLCACTCAHVYKTDLPRASNKRNVLYFTKEPYFSLDWRLRSSPCCPLIPNCSLALRRALPRGQRKRRRGAKEEASGKGRKGQGGSDRHPEGP
jgi:hypothetical protein